MRSIIYITMLLLAGGAFLVWGASLGRNGAQVTAVDVARPTLTVPASRLEVTDSEFDGRRVERTASEWRSLLSADEYLILREEGTEKPFSGILNKNKRKGGYHCAACGLVVFRSNTKYDSGTGWPSFYRPAFKKNVAEKVDRSLPSEERIEVECARCGSHLGHVFDDGPQPTGLRYCINSIALKFNEKK